MTEPRMPVLVGCAQLTQKLPPAEARSPLELLAEVSRRALAASGAGEALLAALDAVGVMRFTLDSLGSMGGPSPGRRYPNPPRSLARSLGTAARTEIYTTVGGNSPQLLVNEVAARIAAGDVEVALIAGAEALATLRAATRQGMELPWGDDEEGQPEILGEDRPGTSETELAHGLLRPVHIYPLFENALRGVLARSLEEHRLALGRLFSPFTGAAAANPHAWFRDRRTAEEISTPSADNRLVALPYTKRMCAIIAVDMAAAVVMTSEVRARELGLDPARFVYLHGCADARNHWYVSDRVDYHSSPALRVASRQALDMAGLGLGDIAHFDLYSCFPSAVEIACQELGLDSEDPRGLTITGGLPYHGGPGNDYALHAIATMMERLRADRGSYGLVSADGYYVTKHSLGVYGCRPPARPFRRPDAGAAQREIEALRGPQMATSPRGRGRVETYTVINGRSRPERGIVVGRLEDGRRFLANTPDDGETLERMMRTEMLARRGTVTPGESVHRFEPDWD